MISVNDPLEPQSVTAGDKEVKMDRDTSSQRLHLKAEPPANSSSSAPRKTFQDVQVLQQRLLLLNHAMKCTADPAGQCIVSQHCCYMRKLWRHLLKCKDKDCTIPHCVSSRYVLTHYGSCQDKLCAICPRVKESMKRDRSNDPAANTEDDSCSVSKRPRQMYWWASGQLLQSKQTISIPQPAFRVDGLNRNLSQMSLLSGNQYVSDDSSCGYSCHSAGSMSTARSYSSVDSVHSRSSSPFTKLEFPDRSEGVCGTFHIGSSSSYIGSRVRARSNSGHSIAECEQSGTTTPCANFPQ